jgi:hypothetical protein
MQGTDYKNKSYSISKEDHDPHFQNYNQKFDDISQQIPLLKKLTLPSHLNPNLKKTYNNHKVILNKTSEKSNDMNSNIKHIIEDNSIIDLDNNNYYCTNTEKRLNTEVGKRTSKINLISKENKCLNKFNKNNATKNSTLFSNNLDNYNSDNNGIKIYSSVNNKGRAVNTLVDKVLKFKINKDFNKCKFQQVKSNPELSLKLNINNYKNRKSSIFLNDFNLIQSNLIGKSKDSKKLFQIQESSEKNSSIINNNILLNEKKNKRNYDKLLDEKSKHIEFKAKKYIFESLNLCNFNNVKDSFNLKKDYLITDTYSDQINESKKSIMKQNTNSNFSRLSSKNILNSHETNRSNNELLAKKDNKKFNCESNNRKLQDIEINRKQKLNFSRRRIPEALNKILNNKELMKFKEKKELRLINIKNFVTTVDNYYGATVSSDFKVKAYRKILSSLINLKSFDTTNTEDFYKNVVKEKIRQKNNRYNLEVFI